MKKLLTSIILSLTILNPVNTLACQTNQNYHVAKVINIYQEDGIYYTSLVDTEGEQWILEADQDLSGKWLHIKSNTMGTEFLYDDEITNYTILD